jgi:predicted Zn-dependent protease
MNKGIGKEILLLVLFFGATWGIVSYFSEDEVSEWNIIPEDLLEELGDYVLEDLERKASLQLIANDTFSLESWNEILSRLDFKNSNCRAIYLIKNSEINAYTLPGDNILIYTGLIEFIGDGEELAAVLAHEMGHIEYKHMQEILAERFAVATLLLMASGEGGASLILELSDALFTAAFSRANEKEADKYGLDLLEQGNIDSGGMIRFFEKLDKDNLDVPDLLSRFNTHPLNKERIEFIRTYANQKSENKPLEMDWVIFKEEMLVLSNHRNE